MKTMNY